MNGVDKSYISILESLKEKIRHARLKTAITVNTELLALYWEIGRTISQQQKQEGWGAKVIEKLAQDLKKEFPDFKGLSLRNLWYMKSFAETWAGMLIVQPPVAQLQNNENHNFKFVQPLVAQIPWAHHIVLLNKTNTEEERLFYLQKTVENGWSKTMLAQQIDNQLYIRQGNAITNFELTLPKNWNRNWKRKNLKNNLILLMPN
jgi:predicted nuclease of restriction endonuclease-like (RecB) superfamily